MTDIERTPGFLRFISDAFEKYERGFTAEDLARAKGCSIEEAREAIAKLRADFLRDFPEAALYLKKASE